MTQTLIYIGQSNPYFEPDSTGRQRCWKPQEQQDVPDAVGTVLLATGVFSAPIGGAGQTRLDTYMQPDATGVWAARPSALSLAIPAWAKKLKLGLGAGGGGGGSGRRFDNTQPRSGGASGIGGASNVFVIYLLDAVGAQLATTVTLTLGVGTAGGAAVTVDNTNGNASPGPSVGSTLVFNGVSYLVGGGGGAAPGGAASAISSGSGPQVGYPTTSPNATNVAANLGTTYPNGITSGGGPGGSLAITTNAVLTPGNITLVGLLPSAVGASTTPGADGAGQLCGVVVSARGGNGGAANTTANAQAGGNGIYGSGGGGGGASLNSFASGAGGMGGHGWAVLLWE